MHIEKASDKGNPGYAGGFAEASAAANHFTKSITTRVRYQETDKGNRVYHAQYLVWLDMARTEYLRSHGIDYARFEEEGYFLVVKKVEVDYHFPAQFDDLIDIVINRIERQKIRVDFYYDIVHNSSKKLLASAYTQLVCINKKGKPIKIPEKMISILSD
ncbi:MAG: thioesterase family protein [Candidatus Margulisbacteria bacterium]|nr:thioesterase family protein [Candidatus Margulisiibacteriota bacterium]